MGRLSTALPPQMGKRGRRGGSPQKGQKWSCTGRGLCGSCGHHPWLRSLLHCPPEGPHLPGKVPWGPLGQGCSRLGPVSLQSPGPLGRGLQVGEAAARPLPSCPACFVGPMTPLRWPTLGTCRRGTGARALAEGLQEPGLQGHCLRWPLPVGGHRCSESGAREPGLPEAAPRGG